MKSPDKKVIKVPGFRFAGISSGIKKSGQKDLALIFSERPAVVAALFTTNKIKAAPVKVAIENFTTNKKCRAIIINSGNANACTGNRGMLDARKMIKKTAEALGISADLVYASSTGVIGRPLPIDTIQRAIPSLVHQLSPHSLSDAAASIATTDTFIKMSSKKISVGGKTGTIAGIAKGAGMICPNMATMLCFLMTDIAVNQKVLGKALNEAVNSSFNRLAVDNDMSTNDTVMVLANGALGNKTISGGSPYFRSFKSALKEVAYDLARMIAEDGEGATKLIEVIVKGARQEHDADKIAKTVSNSMLVKTAIYGNDPNWGRIIAAIGYSGVEVAEQKIDIDINGIKLVRKGVGTNKEENARNVLKNKQIMITINLREGQEAAKFLTCDLTEGYIKINAHYTT